MSEDRSKHARSGETPLGHKVGRPNAAERAKGMGKDIPKGVRDQVEGKGGKPAKDDKAK